MRTVDDIVGARRPHITPFGLWLVGWMPQFERYGAFDLERGWRLGCANGAMLAFFAARPDYDIWGRTLIFWGHICVVAVGRARFRWWRGRIVSRPLYPDVRGGNDRRAAK